MQHEDILKFLLRLIGTSSLAALIFVFVPHSVMNRIHEMLGMGMLPDAPIVSYLARSTSAFYALLGGLMWLVSFDVRKYRQIIAYLGIAFMLFGIGLFVIDWESGMPFFWKVWEGPFVLVFGGALFWFSRRM